VKDKLNLNLIITIGTILISIGSAYGIVQAKLQDVDKLKDKTEVMDKRVIKVEVNLENIDENLKEQKANVKEIREDMKEVIRLLSKRIE